MSVLLYFFLQIEVLQSQVPSLHGHGSGAPLVFLVDVVLLRSVVPLEEVRSEFARLYVLDQNGYRSVFLILLDEALAQICQIVQFMFVKHMGQSALHIAQSLQFAKG